MVKSPKEIAMAYCDISVAKTSNATWQMCMLGFLAGCYAAIAGYMYHVMTQDLAQYLGVGMARFFGGSFFVSALVLIVFSGSELFTGNCLITIGMFAGRIKPKDVLRNWTCVYTFNMVGAVLIGYLIYSTGLCTVPIGVGALRTAVAKVNIPLGQLLLRAVFCNWMVCLAVWMAAASDDALGKIALMWFPITTFVVCGYEHCIVNMFYLSFGMFIKAGSPEIVAAANIDPAALANLDMYGYWFRNMIPVTIGNIVGAVFFVSFFYFTIYKKHLIKSEK